MIRSAVRIATGRARKVKLVWWLPKNRPPNFGDLLSRLIVERILAASGRSLDETIPRYRIWQRPRRLLAIGSILHLARHGDTIWGSGRNEKIPVQRHGARQLDVRMLRGPLTRSFLAEIGIEAPARYGEPGLLAARLLGDEVRPDPSSHDYVFIPNLNDLSHFDDPALVSPLDPWRKVLGRIAGAPLVIGSSLHAIVVAESFGIPARLVRSRIEPPLKYQDYYLGTGRSNVGIASSIEEARAMGGARPPEFDTDSLLASFPGDLWD